MGKWENGKEGKTVSSSLIRSHAWIEIDLAAVRANFAQVAAYKKPEVRCMAVVKANGYGLGAEALSKTLARAGCDAFGVTTVAQGAALRRAGIRGLILVLGPSQQEEWQEAIEEDLTLSISEVGMLRDLNEYCTEFCRRSPLDIHLEIETGLGRTGLFPEDLKAVLPLLRGLRSLKVTGIYTHFAQAENKKGEKYTRQQFRQFSEAVAFLEENGIHPGLRHVCNSPALLAFPEFQLDMVRIGTLLIGQSPAPHLGGKLKLVDPWTAKARILQVKVVPAGKHIGYDGLYKTRANTQLAMIGLGYADGFSLEPRLVPKGLLDLIKIVVKNIILLCNLPWYAGSDNIFLGGHRVRVAGKVGMELTMLDVGQMPCDVGQEVIVPMRRASAGPRMQRIYIDEQAVISAEIQAGIPVELSAELPVELPAEQPVELPAEQPVELPAEQPVVTTAMSVGDQLVDELEEAAG
ncbi:MAG: alanine racemase [Peptococcaceae bacterium]|nr:alanine racemase [Peptococcaceae bacterium]